jgi:hypothetical protein
VSRRCCWQPAGGQHLQLLVLLVGLWVRLQALLLGLLVLLHCSNQVLL